MRLSRQIFAASGQQIRGINRKGKEFFKVVTNLTETIRNIYVEETKIWTSTRECCIVLSARTPFTIIREPMLLCCIARCPPSGRAHFQCVR